VNSLIACHAYLGIIFEKKSQLRRLGSNIQEKESDHPEFKNGLDEFRKSISRPE
jgi:hypothetical protein